MQKIFLSLLGTMLLSTAAVYAKNHTDYRTVKENVMENDRNILAALRDKKVAQIKTTANITTLTSLTSREEARQIAQLKRRERILHNYASF